MFCFHKWETVAEWKEKSPYIKNNTSLSGAPYDYFLESYCIKQQCTKCGKARLIVKKV